MKPSHRLGERYRNVPVLVLGAGGFIGRWVARALSSMGADLCLAVRDATRAEEIFSRYGVAGKVMAADLTNPESIRPLLLDARPAVLFNLAGYGVDPAERDEKTAYQMNADLIGTIYRTLVSAGDTSWPGQQFVHVGSALEYGSLGGDLSEDAQPRPSTVYGKSKLEGTQYLYNDHFESDCYHPLLLFNQHGDCLAAKLRPSNVHSAEDWNELLLPEIERQQAVCKQFAFRGDAAFAKPEVYKSSEERGVQYAIRIPANKSLELEIEDILFRPPGRPSRKPLVRYKSFRYQVESWSKLRRIVAKVEHHLGELFPPRWLHRHEHELAKSLGGAFLQQARHRRAVDQGRQASDALDAAVVPSISSERGAAATERHRLRPGEHVAATGAAAQDQELVADELAAAADEDGRSAGQACSLLVAAGGGASEPAAVR